MEPRTGLRAGGQRRPTLPAGRVGAGAGSCPAHGAGPSCQYGVPVRISPPARGSPPACVSRCRRPCCSRHRPCHSWCAGSRNVTHVPQSGPAPGSSGSPALMGQPGVSWGNTGTHEAGSETPQHPSCQARRTSKNWGPPNNGAAPPPLLPPPRGLCEAPGTGPSRVPVAAAPLDIGWTTPTTQPDTAPAPKASQCPQPLPRSHHQHGHGAPQEMAQVAHPCQPDRTKGELRPRPAAPQRYPAPSPLCGPREVGSEGRVLAGWGSQNLPQPGRSPAGCHGR